jgi:hypothetical protein
MKPRYNQTFRTLAIFNNNNIINTGFTLKIVAHVANATPRRLKINAAGSISIEQRRVSAG